MLETKELTDNQLAYIAGFLDGEGCLMVGKYPKGDSKNLAYRGFMNIANTYVPILEWIQNAVGGKIIRTGKGKSVVKSNMDCYSLTFAAGEMRYWLPKLLPFLKVKKEQAEVLLDFLKRQSDNASAPVSEEILEFYERCYQKLKQLKIVRFEYKRPQYQLVEKLCKQCGAEFQWSSQSPKKIYCSRRCKKIVHYTRSNRRIALGVKPWASLESN